MEWVRIGTIDTRMVFFLRRKDERDLPKTIC